MRPVSGAMLRVQPGDLNRYMDEVNRMVDDETDLRAAREQIAQLKVRLARLHAAHGLRIRDLESQIAALLEFRAALFNVAEDLSNSRHEVQQSHLEWKAAFDAVPDAVFLHDKEFRVVRANRAYLREAGLAAEELLGRRYWEVFPRLAGPLTGCLHSLEDEAEGEEQISLEDGRTFQSRTFPIYDPQGNYLSSVHLLQDVTQPLRIEAERRLLSEALRQSAVAMLIADPQLQTIYINPAFRALFGYEPQDLAGKPAAFGGEGGDGRHAENTVAQLDRHGVWTGEVQHPTKEGRLIPVQLSAAAIRNEHETLTGYIFTYSDLRDVKEERRCVEVLRGAIESLSAQPDLEAIGVGALNEACRLTGAELGLVALRVPDLSLLEYRWHRGVSEAERGAGALVPFEPGTGMPGVVYETGDSLIVDDFNLGGELPPCPPLQVRSAIAVPIPINGIPVGVLCLADRHRPRAFREVHRPILEAVARQLGMGLQRQGLLDEVQASEMRLRAVLENASDIISVLDAQGHIRYVSPSCERLLGYAPEQLLGEDAARLLHPEEREAVADAVWRAAAQDVVRPPVQHRVRHRDGTWRHFESASRQSSNVPLLQGTVVTLRDITDRKWAEEALIREHDFISAVLDTVGALVVVLDVEGRIVRFNHACERVSGYSAAEVIGEPIWHTLLAPEEREAVHQEFQRLTAGRSPSTHENCWVARDGTRHTIAWSNTSLCDAAGAAEYVIATGIDITRRRRTEALLHKRNRALQTLSACNEALVHATDEVQLLQRICRIVVESGGYSMAWVGYLEHDSLQRVQVVASAGDEGDYLGRISVTWSESGAGADTPTSRAIRTLEPAVCAEIADGSSEVHWRVASLARGDAAVIAFPLLRHGVPFGALTIHAAVSDAFNAEEVERLQELADDLSFGIVTLRDREVQVRAEAQALQALERFGHAMEQAVQAVALTVEKRDPYTAGHQQRTAQLAAAIAGLMGLPEERIHGIRLGGMIHDIGKIYIPAEILNRPTSLSQAEFDIIKSHPQVGYDIIKGVDFPWPVGQMILQHHERLDGSGYPAGLRGDQIILEARILSVADVVEAMASHRPYRAGLGIEAALEEIAAGSGSQYDAQVVEACLALIRDHGYTV